MLVVVLMTMDGGHWLVISTGKIRSCTAIIAAIVLSRRMRRRIDMKATHSYRQTIKTHYLGPTNARDSRISVSCYAKRRYYEWDDSLGVEDNHRLACERMSNELGWNGEWIGGWVKDFGYVWVDASALEES
jgi:hypothetical protein